MCTECVRVCVLVRRAAVQDELYLPNRYIQSGRRETAMLNAGGGVRDRQPDSFLLRDPEWTVALTSRLSVPWPLPLLQPPAPPTLRRALPAAPSSSSSSSRQKEQDEEAEGQTEPQQPSHEHGIKNRSMCFSWIRSVSTADARPAVAFCLLSSRAAAVQTLGPEQPQQQRLCSRTARHTQ